MMNFVRALVCLLVIGLPSIGSAETGKPETVKPDTVKAVCFDLYETFQIDLGPGEKADLTVHLKSAGDPFNGYVLQLYRFPFRASAAPLKEVPADLNGVGAFRGLVPGQYHVQLKGADAAVLPVQIADMRLEKSPIH